MQAPVTDWSGVVHALAACACELNTGIFQHPYQAPQGALLTLTRMAGLGRGEARVTPYRTHNSCYIWETYEGGMKRRVCPTSIYLN